MAPLRDENLRVILGIVLADFNPVFSFFRFPEMQFFQQENVRKILTDVLFCYARENEQLLYKQVMKISYRWHPLTQNFLYSLTNDRAIMQPLLYPKLHHNSKAIKELLVSCMVRKVSSLTHICFFLIIRHSTKLSSMRHSIFAFNF